MICELCGAALTVCKINEDYHVCSSCNTQILSNRESFEEDFYASTYLTEDDASLFKFLKANNGHYSRFFGNVLNKDLNFLGILNSIISTGINDCHCYGGGFPQLEAFLPIKNINIYDLIAYKYKIHIDKYLKVYNVDKKVTYNVHDLKNGFVNITTPTIFTFVHILEHFPIKDILEFLNNLNKSLVSGSYIFIYQPNPEAARNKKWTHYINQHVTFININEFTKLINNLGSFKVEYTKAYSDDLLIIFKKI
jgi:hypothetical protein